MISNDKIVDATGAGDVFAAGFLAMQIIDRRAMKDGVKLGIRLMRTKLRLR